ncbi:MAG: hypothetical protein KGY70_16960 [Bacteroidales bacterium]|nr:hypothetical protein [Bacteroidales bacterium]
MDLTHLMQNDVIVQETIMKQTRALKPGECLFAYFFFGAICFKKVRNKKRFWFWYRPFKPIYLTKYILERQEDVKVLGMIIERRPSNKEIKRIMRSETDAAYNKGLNHNK